MLDKAKQTIEKNPVALATVNNKGKPNVIAVSSCKVVSKNQILITDNFMKTTKENILENGKACLAVWNKKGNGFKIEGKAKYFTKGKWKKTVEKMPENKGLSAKGAILLTASKISKLC